MSNALSYYLVEDHTLLVEGLKNFLASELPQGFYVGAASSVDQAREFLSKNQPQIVFVDHRIGAKTGLDLIRSLAGKCEPANFILMSQLDNKMILKEYLELGLAGLISKADPPEEILAALKGLGGRKTYLSQSFKELIETVSVADVLTPREISILKVISMGKTNKDVGKELFCSELTVKTHKSNIMRKLNLKNSVELSVWALKNNVFGQE